MRTITPAAGATLLFEGDSMTNFRSAPTLDTWAWCRLTGAHYGYPERVGDWVFCQRPELAWAVRNGAIAGAVMSEVLARFEQNVVPLKPALVVLTIGSNDAARGVDPAAVAASMATYCTRWAATSGGTVIHLGGVRPADAGQDPALRARTQAIMTAVAATVRAHGGMSLDVQSILYRQRAVLQKLWSGHTVFHDGTHFNPVGAEIMAGIVLRALGLIALPGVPEPQDLV